MSSYGFFKDGVCDLHNLFYVTVPACDTYSQIQRKNCVLKNNIYSNSFNKKPQTLQALIALTRTHLKEVGMRNSALCSRSRCKSCKTRKKTSKSQPNSIACS